MEIRIVNVQSRRGQITIKFPYGITVLLELAGRWIDTSIYTRTDANAYRSTGMSADCRGIVAESLPPRYFESDKLPRELRKCVASTSIRSLNLEQLICLSEPELQKKRAVGPKAVDQIQQDLTKLGLKLNTEPREQQFLSVVDRRNIKYVGADYDDLVRIDTPHADWSLLVWIGSGRVNIGVLGIANWEKEADLLRLQDAPLSSQRFSMIHECSEAISAMLLFDHGEPLISLPGKSY